LNPLDSWNYGSQTTHKSALCRRKLGDDKRGSSHTLLTRLTLFFSSPRAVFCTSSISIIIWSALVSIVWCIDKNIKNFLCLPSLWQRWTPVISSAMQFTFEWSSEVRKRNITIDGQEMMLTLEWIVPQQYNTVPWGAWHHSGTQHGRWCHNTYKR
jgi:hypothetical protein